MRVEKMQAGPNTIIDIFDDADVHVARTIYQQTLSDDVEVTTLWVKPGEQSNGYGQDLVDLIRDDLGDIGDPDLDFTLDARGNFRTGRVRANLGPQGAAFLRSAMAETKRRRDQNILPRGRP